MGSIPGLFESVALLWGTIVAAETGASAPDVSRDAWPAVTALMRSKGVLRQDLPDVILKAHDRVVAARPGDGSADVAAAVSQVAAFVKQIVVDESFVRIKQQRIRGQVRNLLITRPEAEPERDTINAQLDRALELIANENYLGANAALNDVAAWVENFRNKPMAPMPAACREPEPPAECRAWLPKPASE